MVGRSWIWSGVGRGKCRVGECNCPMGECYRAVSLGSSPRLVTGCQRYRDGRGS